MLTNKGYCIPKYLYKRKIEILRQKVMKRKYGYLFYRKTCSNMLPSQARKFYEMRIKKECFKHWVTVWYEERVEWKIILRSDIHYKLTLMQNALRKWKLFFLHRKSLTIKKQIAILHHERHYRKQVIRSVFCKWKFFLQCRVYRKYLMETAMNHYKKKVYPELLRDYFTRWFMYMNWSKRNNLKIKTAIYAYETNVTRKCLKRLLWYTSEKRNTKVLITSVESVFRRSLKRKCLNIWKEYVKSRLQAKENETLATTHYCYKLKVSCLSRLIKNKARNKMINRIIETASNNQNRRMLQIYFKHLQWYLVHKNQKRAKILHACNCYANKLQKIYFRHWQSYVGYRRNKLEIQKRLLDRTVQHLNVIKKRYIFETWKQYYSRKQRKKSKFQHAVMYSRHSMLKQTFFCWSKFIGYKKNRETQLIKSTVHYKQKLVRNCLNNWRRYVMEEKAFKENLSAARKHYRSEAVVEGLRLIIKSGLIAKQQRLEVCKERLCRELFLTHKYSSIWKRKVLYRDVLAEKKYVEGFEENIPRSLTIEWVPICCLTPRILKNPYEDQ